MSTKTKVALVTGGSRGLGKNMAIALAKKSIDVILTYNSNTTAADEVVKEIEAFGRKAKAFQLDTSNINSFENFVDELKTYLTATYSNPNFDFLINNAGTALYAPITDVTEKQMDDIFNIHFKGVFFLTQKALPFIDDGGAIVNVSSGLARFSYPGRSAYAAMKGGIEVLTRYQAKELGTRRIRVNTIAPGAIETDFSGGVVRDNQQLNQAIASQTPLGRVGLPDDIGSVVAFLCSDEAKWVNAQRLEVAGGIHA